MIHLETSQFVRNDGRSVAWNERSEIQEVSRARLRLYLDGDPDCALLHPGYEGLHFSLLFGE